MSSASATSLRSPPTTAQHNAANELSEASDPELVRYSLKVGLCAVISYVIGIVCQRPEMSTILATAPITALPSYGRIGAQDDPSDRWSSDRRYNFSSRHYHRHAQFRDAAGLSAGALFIVFYVSAYERRHRIRRKADKDNLRARGRRLEPVGRHL